MEIYGMLLRRDLAGDYDSPKSTVVMKMIYHES